MHSADYAVARRLSACLSVTRRYSVDTAEYILNFLPSGSPTILVFPCTKRDDKHSDECKGFEKNYDFRQISRFVSVMMEDRASYYGRRIGNRTQAFE